MNIALVIAFECNLKKSIGVLLEEINHVIKKFGSEVKIGRTHLQDATPISIEQEFSAYHEQINNCYQCLLRELEGLKFIAQGGTAVGTGLNTYEGFDVDVCKQIGTITSMQFLPSPNKCESIASHDRIMRFDGALNSLAVACFKIANDIRLLGSGPRCGFSELILPANEPGSSIMPGKTNPTQCEALTMISAQVMGNHQATTIGCSQGHLQVTIYMLTLVECFQANDICKCTPELEATRRRHKFLFRVLCAWN